MKPEHAKAWAFIRKTLEAVAINPSHKDREQAIETLILLDAIGTRVEQTRRAEMRRTFEVVGKIFMGADCTRGESGDYIDPQTQTVWEIYCKSKGMSPKD